VGGGERGVRGSVDGCVDVSVEDLRRRLAAAEARVGIVTVELNAEEETHCQPGG